MRRACVAVDAAMLATAIGIQRLAEMDVGRVVMADHAARAFFGNLGTRARQGLVEHGMLPAVVFGMVADRLEAPFRIGGGAAAFEGARRLVHLLSLRAHGLTGGDMHGPPLTEIVLTEMGKSKTMARSCDGSFRGTYIEVFSDPDRAGGADHCAGHVYGPRAWRQQDQSRLGDFRHLPGLAGQWCAGACAPARA